MAENKENEIYVENLIDGGTETAARDKRLEFLLKQTEIFSHFVTNSLKPVTKGARKQFAELTNTDINHNKPKKETKKSQNQILHFESTPKYIQNGELRDYQVRGLNWMISLYENGINGILADEMGLGKTLQTIAFLGYLKNYKNICGPHLIVVPKSTLHNWMNEFEKWCPSLRAVEFIGDKLARKFCKQDTLTANDWDVCITSYEMVIKEKFHLKRYNWCYLVIDEAHRIKNEKSKLSVSLREIKVAHSLLLTGTPLQNSLHELWALLNFMLPDVFNSAEDFDNWFNFNTLGDAALVQRLQSVLKPFLLRRLKSEVEKSLPPKTEIKIYVGLSKMQREWYTNLLLKNMSAVNGGPNKVRLQNILMQLRKCTNHPYLFPGAEPGPPFTTNEHLINNCGKMFVLDKLLPKLQKRGSRVLLFSQMTRMLDILEDYMMWRQYDYCRLDGQTKHKDRESRILEFNRENSSKFIFMLSTRAGGLGINLATADVVIIYDSDWNPQMDLQAMDRAHRIGQKKEVTVFRLITENTVEERIMQFADIKLRLDKTVHQGRAGDKLKGEEMKKIIQFGAAHVMASKDSEITDEDIDKILERGQTKTAAENAKLDQMGESALRAWTLEETVPYTVYNFEGEDYREKRKQKSDFCAVNLPERRAKSNAACTITKSAVDNSVVQRPTNKTMPQYRFYTQRFKELKEKELKCYKKQTQIHFTEEDRLEMLEEEKKAFINWTRVNLKDYVNACEKYGRQDIESIIKCVQGQPADEIRRYHQVFWARYHELTDYESILRKIERGEERILHLLRDKKMLADKIAKYRAPLSHLRINYDTMDLVTDEFTAKDDRFLLVTLNELGPEKENVYDELHSIIQSQPRGKSNFLLSRTPKELENRCDLLFILLEIELENAAKERVEVAAKRAKRA